MRLRRSPWGCLGYHLGGTTHNLLLFHFAPAKSRGRFDFFPGPFGDIFPHDRRSAIIGLSLVHEEADEYRRSRVGSAAYQVFGASIIVYIRIALTLYCFFFDFSLCLNYILALRRPRYLRPVQALHRAVCLSLLPHTSRQLALTV